MPDTVTVLPEDQYNQTLVSHVHPNDWQNPTPVDTYDVVVIGAGTAGLIVAAGSAGLDIGLKIALIEKHLMGGDCLNVGCVPSKCLISSARAAGDAMHADRLGVHFPETKVDFPAVMERLRKVRSGISHHDSAQRFSDLGIDVYLGEGKFLDHETVAVGDTKLKFKKAVIATGARAVRPNIPGLEEAGYLTNESVFSLMDLPSKLAVIGAGPIGCELAQSFQRLGSQVVLLHKNSHVLDKEDPDAAEIIQKQLLAEGMQIELGMQIEKVAVTPEGKALTFKQNGEMKTVVVDEILVGAGRQPNVESLNLEAVGVEYHPRKGVMVNDYMQTANPKIYAAGDICMDWKFTHAADAAAQIVIKNALFAPFGMGKSKLSDLIMPWVTFTAPEVAHVGLYESQAQAKGIATKHYSVPFSTVDRALADGEENGFVKVLLKEGSDEILGATIVAAHAGEMISEITLAMNNKIGLGKFASVIHPYPTQAEAIKKAASLYRKTLLTPKTKKLLKLLNKFA